MSDKAFIQLKNGLVQNGRVITADEASTIKDKNNCTFLCCNSSCNAELCLRRKKEKNGYYFAAKPSKPHIIGCSEASSTYCFNREYDERNFDIYNILQAITSRTDSFINTNISNVDYRDINVNSVITPHTMRQIYLILSQHNINDIVGVNRVSDILVDKKQRESILNT